MILYKLTHVLPYYKDKYLSTKVKKEKSNNFLTKKINIGDLLKNYWLIILIPIIFIVLVTIFCVTNLSGFNNVIDFMKTLITLPLLLVSTVIPIVTLIITIVGNQVGSKFVKLYLDILKPLDIFIIAVLSLIVNITLYFISITNFQIINYPFSGLISRTAMLSGLVLTFILIPLIGTSWLILRTIKLILDDDSLYDSITKYMKNKMINSLELEIEQNISDNLFKKRCNTWEIEFIPFFSRMEKYYKPLKAKKTGLIIDINLEKLDEFGQIIGKIQKVKKKVIVTKGPGNLISKEDNLLCYVNREFDKEIYIILEDIINEVFIVTNNSEQTDIKDDLDNLKTLVKNTVSKDAEDKFRKIIDIYSNCLENYMLLIEQIDSNYIPNKEPFESFRVLTLIHWHLDDIAKWNVQRSNENLIQIFSYGLFNILTKTVNYQNYEIFDLINHAILRMYYLSLKKGNVKQIYNPLINISNLENEIENRLEDPELSSIEFISLKKFLYKIIDSLTSIGTTAISNNDFKTFEIVEDYFSDILMMYEPSLDLWDSQYEIAEKIKGLEKKDSQYKSLKEELNVVNSRINLDNDVKNKILINWVQIGNGILKCINNGSVDGRFKESLKKVFDKFSDNIKLLEIFDFMAEEIHFSLSEYSLFFCLGQLRKWKYSELPSSKTIKFNINIIENTCKKIIEEKDQWTWLIDLDIEETVKILIESCQKSFQKYDIEEENEIIELPLSPKKIKDFKEKIKNSIDNTSKILSFLSKYENVVHNKSYRSGKYNEIIDLASKAPFVEIESPTYYESAWRDYSREIRVFINNNERFIVEKILGKTDVIIVENNKENLTNFIDKYVAEMESDGYSPLIMFVPIKFSRELLKEKISRKKVINEKNDNNEIEYFYENKMIIFKHRKIPNNIILIVDPKQSKLIQVEELKIDIRIPSEDDKIELHEYITDRKLDLRVIIEIKEHFDFEFTNDAILKIQYNN